MMVTFTDRIKDKNPEIMIFKELKTLQINMGNLCNQRCHHCHVGAGPDGKLSMDKDVVMKIVEFLKSRPGLELDITGGAPEMNPNFTMLVRGAKKYVRRILVRSNLTVILQKGFEWLPQFYVENGIVIVASLPCYTEKNVDAQRGEGVFQKSIKALKKLNDLGYGSDYELNLVYNPGGEFLPGNQKTLEMDYKKHLSEEHGIVFSNLFTITNCPLGNFKKMLEKKGKYEEYMQLLYKNYNVDAAENIMCRTLLSVDHEGKIYNCDFNQVCGISLRTKNGSVAYIDDMPGLLKDAFPIVFDDHCYGCTAGTGSSCQGSLCK